MDYLKFKNEFQFLSDFSVELKNYLEKDYIIENNKKVGLKDLDLFIKNPTTGHTFTVEVKGQPNQKSLPPEIIPWLENLKNKTDGPNNHFIVFSFANVNENVKTLFNQSGLEIFEYEKHKENLAYDFKSFLNEFQVYFTQKGVDGIKEKYSQEMIGKEYYFDYTEGKHKLQDIIGYPTGCGFDVFFKSFDGREFSSPIHQFMKINKIEDYNYKDFDLCYRTLP